MRRALFEAKRNVAAAARSKGVYGLGFSTLGPGVPYLVIAAGVGGPQRITRALARAIRPLNIAGGILVIVMGLVLVSGQFARLPQLFNFL